MEKVTRRHLLIKTTALALGLTALRPITTAAAEYPSLENYLGEIEAEKQKHLPRVESNDLFKGFEDSCNERRVEDFSTYFPIYKAGELEHGVPWPLLWTIHVHETMVSTSSDPAASGYVGAMQRADWLWKDSQLLDASSGWDFLADLPQRYFQSRFVRKNPFSVDYQEIMWAAWFIRSQAQIRYSNLPPIDGFLTVVRQNYSAEVYGRQRVSKYLELAGLFSS